MARAGFHGKARVPASTRKADKDGMVFVRIAKDGAHNDLMEQYCAPYEPGVTHTGMGAEVVTELETASSFTLRYPKARAEEYEKFCVDTATARRQKKRPASRGPNMEQAEESSEIPTTLGEQAGLG